MAAKKFAVGDVLPATTQLRISWENQSFPGGDINYRILTNNNNNDFIFVYDDFPYAVSISIYTNTGQWTSVNGIVDKYYIIDTSTWSESERTISEVNTFYFNGFTYEDVASVGYSITFVENGGSTVTDLTEQTALPNPLPTTTKPGYTFGGWYYDSDFTNEAFADDPLTGDVTLYAKWELNTYTITYNSNGGSIVPQTSNATQLPSPLPTTTKENHVFAGWYYDNLFTQKANAGDELTANVTLYAKWYTPTTWCEDIADAIREKEGSSEPIKHVDFPDRIRALEGGIDVSDANAVVGEVLTGKTFYAVDDTKKTGTMPNRGTVNTDITTKAQEVTIQQGYHSGSGKVKISATEQAKIIASNIKSGVTILGQEGAVTPAKEEQTKTVSPTTSSQDVLPDSGKVLSKVTVNAIPTETKSQQPNLSSGNQTINATSGKFMTSFTITKDTINHIASNIRSGITLYGVTGNLQPAKEEETKTVTPNFSSGNVVVTPTTGKVLSQVTINKDGNLIADNIKKDITVHGITGTYEGSGGGGYTVTFTDNNLAPYSYTVGGIHYSFDNGVTYHPITTIKSVITDSWEIVPAKLMGVTQIRFKIVAKNVYNLWASVGSVLTPSRQSGNWSAESSNITLSSDVTYGLEWWED